MPVILLLYFNFITVHLCKLVEEFQSLAARFGPNFPPNGMRVYAIHGEPADGCAPMEEAPKNYTIHGTPMRFAAVISRGDCTFAGT